MELSCWGGDWGLPSLHPESLTVMVTGGGHRPAREGGREERRRPGACLPPARTAAGLLLAPGEAGGGRRAVGPAARAWLVPLGRRGQRCRPFLPGGAQPFPVAARPLPCIPRSRTGAMKPDRNPSRTCRWLVFSPRRCLMQLLTLCFTLFLHVVTDFLPCPPIFIAGLRQIFWCSPDSEYYK